MYSQLPGVLTRIIPATVSPRKTSSDKKRAEFCLERSVSSAGAAAVCEFAILKDTM